MQNNNQISFVSIFAIVIIVMLLFAGNCFGQINLQNPFKYNYRPYSTRYDTVIENEGNINCIHKFIIKPPNDYTMSNCGVLHDSRGCSNNWEVITRICEKCYRKEVINEVRYYSDENNQTYNERINIIKETEKEFNRLDSLARMKK
ncbi:MAG: hypothetical protein ABIJ40_18925 [Bacteroidota bacterium]